MEGIKPYISFKGNCKEAIDFYKDKLGAEVLFSQSYGESPMADKAPGNEDKVMHASLTIGETRVMASDGRNTGNPKFDGFALSVNAKDDADADRLFNGLSTGGKVVMPLGKTFFSPRFGMTQDKFGVNWMVIVEPN